MKITNLSEVNIVCIIDNITVDIQPGCDFECSDSFKTITFAPGQKSYSILEPRKSKFLKFLSFFDDPFRLIKEYHLSVNSMFTKESVSDFSRLNITFEKCYADTDTLTFYDYVKAEANGAILRPNAVSVSEQEQIEKDFIDYNSKLIKWQPAWNLFLGAIVSEIIGYLAINAVFSIWLGTYALIAVLFLLIPNILFEVFMSPFKRKKYKKRADNFINLFNSEAIFDGCYH